MFFTIINEFKSGSKKKAWLLIYSQTKGCFPMLAFILWYFLSYSFLENMTRLQYTNIHVALDDKIPFVEIFIIPYLLWFAFMIFNTSFLFCYDKENYHQVASMLYIGMTIFVIVSLFWPNIQYLRPQVMPRDNIFTRQILKLYSADTPTNICPSIHVYNTVVSMIGIYKCRKTKFGRSPFYKIPMYILGCLIVLSTMFIKQHSVFDVCCAFACVIGAYVLVYHFNIMLSGENSIFRQRSRRKRQRGFI